MESKENSENKVLETKESIKEVKKKFFSSSWYNQNYKKLLMIYLFLMVLGIFYIGYFYLTTGDFFYKDTTLTGGTVLTVYNSTISNEQLQEYLSQNLNQEFNLRTLEDLTTRKKIAIVVETPEEASILESVMESYLGYSLDSENSSLEITGSSLSKSFYRELIFALGLAFLFMALVVFIIFKSPVPSMAVIQAAFADLLFAVIFANLFHFKLSTAGIAALLMLVGYSVDTDILLTTRVLKRRGEGTVNSRIKSSMKTGLIMSLTSLVAVLLGFVLTQAGTLRQIFFILSAGIGFDIFSTWIGNASMIKWYCEKKKII